MGSPFDLRFPSSSAGRCQSDNILKSSGCEIVIPNLPAQLLLRHKNLHIRWVCDKMERRRRRRRSKGRTPLKSKLKETPPKWLKIQLEQLGQQLNCPFLHFFFSFSFFFTLLSSASHGDKLSGANKAPGTGLDKREPP